MGLFQGSARIGSMILAAAMNSDMFSPIDEAVARLKRGDPDALALILSRYQHRLYRFLLRIVRDPATAEDLFQQTFLRIIERINRYDARNSFETWMFSVGHNLAIDHLRRRRVISLDDADEFGASPVHHISPGGRDALQQLIESERGAILASAISQLPVIQRTVISLRFEEDMKLAEIAEVIGVPLATVKSRLVRGLERLRATVEMDLSGRTE